VKIQTNKIFFIQGIQRHFGDLVIKNGGLFTLFLDFHHGQSRQTSETLREFSDSDHRPARNFKHLTQRLQYRLAALPPQPNHVCGIFAEVHTHLIDFMVLQKQFGIIHQLAHQLFTRTFRKT